MTCTPSDAGSTAFPPLIMTRTEISCFFLNASASRPPPPSLLDLSSAPTLILRTASFSISRAASNDSSISLLDSLPSSLSPPPKPPSIWRFFFALLFAALRGYGNGCRSKGGLVKKNPLLGGWRVELRLVMRFFFTDNGSPPCNVHQDGIARLRSF